jgi:hypothetical protein
MTLCLSRLISFWSMYPSSSGMPSTIIHKAMRDRRNNHRMDVEGSPRSQTKCSLTIPCGEHSSIRRMILLGRVAELWETRRGLAKDTTSVAPVIGAAKVES